TLLTPHVPRNTNAAPDLGYCYDPLDYVVSGLSITNATLTLANGVALGVYGSGGLTLQSGSKLVSRGLADNLNRICPYYLAQEIATNWGSALGRVLKLPGTTMATFPEVDLRFTDLPLVPQGTLLYFFETLASGPT